MPAKLNDDERPNLQSVLEGLKYARSRQELLGTYLIDINAHVFRHAHRAVSGHRGKLRRRVGRIVLRDAGGGGVCRVADFGLDQQDQQARLGGDNRSGGLGRGDVVFGLVSSLWLALLFLALAGAADAVSGVFRMTIWNQTIPDHMRGRLAGIEMISYLTGPYLGNAEAGLVASRFGLRASVVSGGVLCVLGAGVLALLLPKFIRYDGREGLARKQAEEAARTALTSRETLPQ